jgi:hypothetical protein
MTAQKIDIRGYNPRLKAHKYAARVFDRAKIKIHPEAKAVLLQLATIRPRAARAILKTITAESLKGEINRFRAPKTILNPFLGPVIEQFQNYIEDCKTENILSLGELLKFLPKPKVRDMDPPFVIKSRKKPITMSFEELSNIKLIRILRKTHLRLKTLSELRKRTEISPDKALSDWVEYDIDGLLGPLVTARKEVAENELGYRAEAREVINEAIRNIWYRKTDKAVELTSAAHDLIHKETDKLEGERLSRDGKPRERISRNRLGGRIRALSLNGYSIRIRPDGTWTIPQTAIKEASGEHFSDKVVHKVNEDAVLRRNRHIIDSCASEISSNVHNIKLLLSAGYLIVGHFGIIPKNRRESIISILGQVLPSYKQALLSRFPTTWQGRQRK